MISVFVVDFEKKTTFGARNILFPCNMKNCQAKYKLWELDLHFSSGKLLFKTVKDDFTNKNKFLQSLFKIHVHVNLIFRTWFCVQVLFISGQIGPKWAKHGFWFQPEVFGASQDQAKNEGLSQRGRERLMFLERQSWRHPVQITFGKKGGKMWCDFPGKAADSRLVVGFNPCSTICKPGKRAQTMGKHGKQITKIGTESPQFQHDPCWMEKGHLPQVSSVLHGCLCQCTYLRLSNIYTGEWITVTGSQN